MEFDFEKFMIDVDKRNQQNTQRKNVVQSEKDIDRARRLRAKQYHERWQNCIIWEKK